MPRQHSMYVVCMYVYVVCIHSVKPSCISPSSGTCTNNANTLPRSHTSLTRTAAQPASHGDYKYGEPVWIRSRGHFRTQRTCSCGEGTARNPGSKRFWSQYKVYGENGAFLFFSLLTPYLVRFSQRYYQIHV